MRTLATTRRSLGVIGNQVWKDTVADGIHDANGVDNIANNADDEPGIPGVSVDLWRNPDGSATLNGDETIIATTTTDTLGQYTFQGVPAGNYFVVVSDTANVLTDYLPSPTQFPPSGTDDRNRVQPYPVTSDCWQSDEQHGGLRVHSEYGSAEPGGDREPAVV